MATAARDIQNRLEQPRFTARLATGACEIESSLRLRHRVFVTEMGADVPDADSGLERDGYDDYCRHLLVRDNETGRVVASTRVLSHEDAERAGGFYSAQEFELDAILTEPGRFMEIGRTCVHPDYRRGGVIATLWSGISQLIDDGGYGHLIGCASIELTDGTARAHGIYRQLRERHMSPANLRVAPRRALPGAGESCPAQSWRLPPLLKAYVSLGARLAGPPCWDPDFGVADLFMHLDVANLCPRYARHFLDRQRRHRSHRHLAAVV